MIPYDEHYSCLQGFDSIKELVRHQRKPPGFN